MQLYFRVRTGWSSTMPEVNRFIVFLPLSETDNHIKWMLPDITIMEVLNASKSGNMALA
ncbi:MAG: hypothetical protein LBR26_00290 [Prevotella sp.]|nr:hypothetical protein [Prevotella sp.]